MRCPNINHPDWKAIVDKVGVDNAYLLYIKNNYDIPDPATVFSEVNAINEAINKIWAINIPTDALPEDFVEGLHGLDVGDNVIVAYENGKFNLYGVGLDADVKFPDRDIKVVINPEGKLDLEIAEPEITKYLRKDLLESDISSGRIRTILSLTDAQDLFIAEADYKNQFSKNEVFEDMPAKNKSELLLPGFDSFYQQNEAVNVLASSYLTFTNDNPEIKAGAWKKAMEAWKTKIEVKHKENPNRAFEAILNNFAAIEELAHQKLQLLGLRKRTRLDGISLDTYKAWMHEQGEDMDNMDEQDVINSWKDEWVFQFDAKDGALKQLKAFLAFIPKSGYDEESDQFYDIDSFIPDEVSFMSYDEVYEQLKGILAGVENTWDAMVEEMQKHTKSKPFIHNLLNYVLPNYSGDIEQLKRQFVSSMSSSYGGFKTILIKEYNGEYYFNTIDTDVSSVQKTLLANWSGQFKRTDLFEETEEGNLVPNKAKVKAYLEKIKEAQAKPTIENVKELLKGIGVDLDEATLKQLVEGKVNRKSIASQFTDKKDGLFTLIAARLQGEVSADINESTEGEETSDGRDGNTNNPIVNNSAITGLAKLEAKNAPYAFSNTFRDGEGNTVYSYTFNKFLTKEFIKLQNNPEYVKELLQITFNKPIVKTDGELLYKTWLYELSNNPTFNAIFNISPFDTVRLVAPGRDGTKLNSMGELDLELTKVALMQNSGATKKGIGIGEARIIKYLLTVPSKTTSYIIQGSGQDVKLRFTDKGEYVIDPATKDALYSIVASEYNRILSQQARKNKNKAYDKGSTLFYFFPELNEDTRIFDENKQLLLPTTILGKDKEGQDITVERYLRKKIVDIVAKTATETYKTWVDLGIVEDNRLKLVDRNYKQKVLDPQAKGDKNKEITLAIVDYVVNSMLAKFNVHQTFIDDPALYFKASKEVKTARGNVDETWSNVSKRLTNLIAPFKDGMIDETNANFLSIKIEDQVVNALNHAQLKGRLNDYYSEIGSKFPYEDITGTDGQEYTTIKEAVKVMYMYGNLTTNLYNDLMARIDKYGDDLVLTENEIGAIFGATKPVYSSRVISKEDDAVYREYIKTAAFPLLPQFTKGLEIDKLRRSMEKVEKKTGLSVRAVSASGTKLGGAGFAPIWKEDGTMDETLDLEKYAVTLDRRNFGEQQPVPYDENKDEVIKSTQVTKLLFDAISEIAGFKFEGARLKGEELQKIYDDLHRKIYEDGLQKLEAVLIKDGQINVPALSKMLIKEGINRGYSDAQLSFLKLNEKGTDFDIPFWAHIANEKEQALITSLYSNNVIKQKMHGGSYVLVSEEGIKGKSLGITYVGNTRKETVSKDTTELLDTPLPAEAAAKKVSIVTIDPTDNKKTVEEYEAATALKDLKEQHTRLESLLQCLTK